MENDEIEKKLVCSLAKDTARETALACKMFVFSGETTLLSDI